MIIFCRIQEQIRRLGLTKDDLEPANNDQEYIPEEPKTSKGEKRKSYEALGNKMKKKRMEPLVEHIREWSEENNVKPGDAAAELARHLANSENDRKKAKIYEKILENQNPFQNQELTVHQAVALKVCNPRAQCRNLRILLSTRFYVKSIFGDFRVSKFAILTI